MFQKKIFICSQCDRNYISILIKFKKQITAVKHTIQMRILLYFNQHHLLSVQYSGSCNLQLARQSRHAVVHRHCCGPGGLAIAAMQAEIVVAAMAQRAENSWQKSFNLFKFIFVNILTNSTTTYSKLYCIFYFKGNFFKINKIRCREKILSTNALK